MSKIANWFRVGIGWISAFFGLSGLASIMLENWLRSQGYIEHPENAVSRLIAWIADPAQSWWLLPLCVTLVAAPCFYAILRLVTIWMAKRQVKLETLGKEMIRAASDIRIRQGGFRNPWPTNFGEGRGKLDAIFIRANKFWIRTPSDDVFASEPGVDVLLRYLDMVGAHLRQGNIKVARKRSKELSA